MAPSAFGCVARLLFVFGSLGGAAALPLGAAPSFLEAGYCAPFGLMEGFEPQKYLGTWYTISNVPNSYIPVKKCMEDVVTMKGDDLEVVTMGFGSEGSRESSEAVLSKVVPLNPFAEPFLQLQASLVPPVPYHIIETNYTSYACVYSCFDILGVRAELFFILSRTPQISSEAKQRCLDLFRENDVNVDKLVEMEQVDCHREKEEEVDGDVGTGQEDVGEEEEQEVPATATALGTEAVDGLEKVSPVEVEDQSDSQDATGCGEEESPAAEAGLKIPDLSTNSAESRDSKKPEVEEETLLEEAEELARELEEDMALAVEVVENSAQSLMKGASEVVTDSKSRQNVEDVILEDHYGSSSPPVSLPRTTPVMAAVILTLFFYR